MLDLTWHYILSRLVVLMWKAEVRAKWMVRRDRSTIGHKCPGQHVWDRMQSPGQDVPSQTSESGRPVQDVIFWLRHPGQDIMSQLRRYNATLTCRNLGRATALVYSPGSDKDVLTQMSEMGRPGQDFASCLRRPGHLCLIVLLPLCRMGIVCFSPKWLPCALRYVKKSEDFLTVIFIYYYLI